MSNVDESSLGDFELNAAEHLARVRASDRPLVLTVDGRAEIVVQGAAAYRRVLALAEAAQAIAGVRDGLSSLDRGEGLPLDQAFDALRERLAAC